jgi:hypothetical protein
MDRHSWNSRKWQGAFSCPCTGSPCARAYTQPPLSGSDGSRRSAVLSNQVLVIGKAYDEPICSIHVENLLLQRDYIID